MNEQQKYNNLVSNLTHKETIKLHLGCGNINIQGYINIDSNLNASGADVFWDITQLDKLNIKPNSIYKIYACHVIEYFDREEIFDILKMWYSLLKPSGILELAVPNFKTMARLYTEGQFPLANFLGPLYGKWKITDGDVIYHKTVYDFYDVKKVLKQVGFNGVERFNWKYTDHSPVDDYSQAYLPHMDKNNGTLISLNVQATK